MNWKNFGFFKSLGMFPVSIVLLSIVVNGTAIDLSRYFIRLVVSPS